MKQTANRRLHTGRLFRLLATVLAVWPAAAPGAETRSEARQILEAAGVTGGLIVHVGCGDGKLTADLRRTDSFLVHGLARTADDVEKAREYVASLGLYGRVSVEQWSGDRLPYVDNVVKLVVASGDSQISGGEIARVLAPLGRAVIKDSLSPVPKELEAQPADALGGWSVYAKRWPDDIDEWTHFLHDASGNPVARDLVAGPPRGIQWTSGPRWSRNHWTLASISAVVSSQGRIFAIVDEASSSSMVPSRWALVARDAFSGVLLWKHPMESWANELRKFRGGPVQLHRLLVADGDRVYAPLGINAPISCLDASSGQLRATYQQTAGAEEMIVCGGVLLAVTAEPFGIHAADHPRFRGRLTGPPQRTLKAVGCETGELLWQWAKMAHYEPLSLAAADGRVFMLAGKGTICLDLEEGNTLWSTATDEKQRGSAAEWSIRDEKVGLRHDMPPLCVVGDIVLADGARSVKDGSLLWNWGGGSSTFVIGQTVWNGTFDLSGRDLRTGKPTRHLSLDDVRTVGHHYRCIRPKATSRYVINSYRGMEFLDLVGENHSRNNWVRGTCQFGIMPCNGLVYVPPHACACYPGVKLHGFWAFAPTSSGADEARDAAAPEKGPAYGMTDAVQTDRRTDEWPTYRHDPLRSGSTSTGLPIELAARWSAPIGGRLSAPVAAEGIALVASVDEHRVVAVDMDRGSVRWSFTAGGRVDSPPTVYARSALFGAADGYVYCLRLEDGALRWRFRVAPSDRRTVAYDNVESVWPVPGSVLVLDDTAYAAAGRSTYLDGGVRLVALDPTTGAVRHETRVASEHPRGAEGIEGPVPEQAVGQNQYDGKTFHAPDRSDSFSMKGGTVADVLVSDGSSIFLKMFRFDRACEKQQRHARHLYSTTGLLDGQEHHSAHWFLGNADFSGIPVSYNRLTNSAAVPCGQMLVFDATAAFVVNASGHRTTGPLSYSLTAYDNRPFTGDDEQLPDIRATKGKKSPLTRRWGARTRFKPRAMVRADNALLVAGEPLLHPDSLEGPHARRDNGILQIFNADTGASEGEVPLSAPPVWDGMAVAAGRVLVATTDGALECLSGASEKVQTPPQTAGKTKP